MGKIKDPKVPHSTARANKDEPVSVAYVAGTPLEAGKIGEAEPIDFCRAAHNIEKAKAELGDSGSHKAPPPLNLDVVEDPDFPVDPKSMVTSPRLFPKKAVFPGPGSTVPLP